MGTSCWGGIGCLTFRDVNVAISITISPGPLSRIPRLAAFSTILSVGEAGHA